MGIAGFADGLGIDADMSGENGAFNLLGGFRKGHVPTQIQPPLFKRK